MKKIKRKEGSVPIPSEGYPRDAPAPPRVSAPLPAPQVPPSPRQRRKCSTSVSSHAGLPSLRQRSQAPHPSPPPHHRVCCVSRTYSQTMQMPVGWCLVFSVVLFHSFLGKGRSKTSWTADDRPLLEQLGRVSSKAKLIAQPNTFTFLKKRSVAIPESAQEDATQPR